MQIPVEISLSSKAGCLSLVVLLKFRYPDGCKTPFNHFQRARSETTKTQNTLVVPIAI